LRSNAIILTVKYTVAISGAVQHFGWIRNLNTSKKWSDIWPTGSGYTVHPYT